MVVRPRQWKDTPSGVTKRWKDDRSIVLELRPQPGQAEEHYDKIMAVLGAYYALIEGGVRVGAEASAPSAGKALAEVGCPARLRIRWASKRGQWVATSLCADHNHAQAGPPQHIPTHEEIVEARKAQESQRLPLESVILQREDKGLYFDRKKLAYLLKSAESKLKMSGEDTQSFIDKLVEDKGERRDRVD